MTIDPPLSDDVLEALENDRRAVAYPRGRPKGPMRFLTFEEGEQEDELDRIRDAWEESPWSRFFRLLPDEERDRLRLADLLLRDPARTERFIQLVQEYVIRIARVSHSAEPPPVALTSIRVVLDDRMRVVAWKDHGLFPGEVGTPKIGNIPPSVVQEVEAKGTIPHVKDAWVAYHEHSRWDYSMPCFCTEYFVHRTSAISILHTSSTHRRMFHLVTKMYALMLRDRPVNPFEPLADLLALKTPLAVTQIHLYKGSLSGDPVIALDPTFLDIP